VLSILTTSLYRYVTTDAAATANSGIDAAAIMTTEGGGIRAPIIAFSADTTQEIREKCQEVGMKDFVSKPATQQTIRDLVMTYCPGLRQ
jgi:CheY-like chemotaxis protein